MDRLSLLEARVKALEDLLDNDDVSIDDDYLADDDIFYQKMVEGAKWLAEGLHTFDAQVDLRNANAKEARPEEPNEIN